jgi:serine/threonine protein kinase
MNALLAGQWDRFACITDFGVSVATAEISNIVKGFRLSTARGLTIPYASPEALERFRSSSESIVLNLSSDIYSLACIIYYALQTEHPWSFEDTLVKKETQ